ncbi:hypothetical protein AB2R53_14655 [Acinetobacter baumannii]|nr:MULTISPECIES: hypothetical protein [Acinetobacter calcoaceticus/baumannii complex]AVI34118.1 hypothetical protein CSB70_0404 [Acinetobacter baumannii]AVI39112.1 hypothetical protein CSB68_2827 [Acinetobacter baumannii]EHU1235784.1 hypothetical protein [Acinetobacter baumannii]EHU1448281.1 hypothetical protein [Acinetobacter baumannii]EHU1570594.1 hypothetical protein [Acinetobacter baumannii]
MNKELSIDLNEVNEDINQIQEEEINPNLFINLYKNTFLSPTETLENSKFAKFIENPRLTYTLNKTSSTVTFTDNFFVSAILFTPEEDGVFELTYINLFDVKKTLKEDKKDKEGRIIFWTNDCVKQISLKFNNEKFFAKKRSNLEKFQLYGLTFNDAITQLNNFYQIKEDRKQYEEIISTKKEELVNKVEEITKKLNEYQEYLEAQEEHEAELNTNIEELKEQKKNLQNNINQHNAEIESLSSQITAKDNQLSKLNDDFLELQKRSKYLTEGNERLEERRKELEKSVNLFPDNLEGFVARATKTKWTYGFLAFIPLLILGFIVNLSWETLKDFTAISTVDTFEKAWIILIQRLPFTLLIITLASMCLAFLYKMVRHLTEIQQQELNLSKISMLARDVSDSEHSSLEEELIQKLRIDRKMKLIREFLNSEFNRYQTFIDKEEQIKDTKFIKIDLPFKGPFISRTND